MFGFSLFFLSMQLGHSPGRIGLCEDLWCAWCFVCPPQHSVAAEQDGRGGWGCISFPRSIFLTADQLRVTSRTLSDARPGRSAGTDAVRTSPGTWNSVPGASAAELASGLLFSGFCVFSRSSRREPLLGGPVAVGRRR